MLSCLNVFWLAIEVFCLALCSSLTSVAVSLIRELIRRLLPSGRFAKPDGFGFLRTISCLSFLWICYDKKKPCNRFELASAPLRRVSYCSRIGASTLALSARWASLLWCWLYASSTLICGPLLALSESGSELRSSPILSRSGKLDCPLNTDIIYICVEALLGLILA